MNTENGKTFIEESLQSVLFYLLALIHLLSPFKEEKQVQLVIFTDGSLLIRIELFIVTGCTCLPSQEGNWLLPSL